MYIDIKLKFVPGFNREVTVSEGTTLGDAIKASDFSNFNVAEATIKKDGEVVGIEHVLSSADDGASFLIAKDVKAA